MNTIRNDFTQTIGTGEIYKIFRIDSSYLNECDIKSISEFYTKYKTKSGKLNRNYLSVEKKLINLKNKLQTIFSNNVDPIQYLSFLAIKEQKSIRDISTKLTIEMGLEGFSKSTLQNLLTITLGFQLKDKHELTDTKKRKDIAKGKNHPLNIERKKETQEIIKKILDENKNKVEAIMSFNIEEYQTLSNIYKRTAYLLYNFGFIKENGIKGLFNLINSLSEKGLGGLRISQVLNKIVNESIIGKHNLKICKIIFHIKFSWEILNKKANL